MLWTVDLVHKCRSARMHYVTRRLPGNQQTRLYYSGYNGWPPPSLGADDCRIQVVLEADEATILDLAGRAENCAVFGYGCRQTHYMPLCWLPAAETWGYRLSRLVGVWVDGKCKSVAEICDACPDKIRLATSQCEPLGAKCLIPFNLSAGMVYEPMQFFNYYVRHRPNYADWPQADFSSLRDVVPKRPPTVDDLE